MAKIKICSQEGCNNAASTEEGYCRLHYLKNWKRLKEESRKKAAKRLNTYIEGIIKKNPGKYVEIIKRDLRNPNFSKIIDQLPVDEDTSAIFGDPSYDEEIEKLIRELKIEKGF